jgi:transcriptional regulator with XRE-family HTH domain
MRPPDRVLRIFLRRVGPDEAIGSHIIKDLREILGMTQAQLADKAKVSEAEVNAWEAGGPTRFDVIREIVSALKRREVKSR